MNTAVRYEAAISVFDRHFSSLRAALSGALLFFAISLPANPSFAAGTLRTVALSGTTAPGTDAQFNHFWHPAINRSGAVAFSAILAGDNVEVGNRNGVWSEGKGTNLSLVARSGVTPVDSGDETFLDFQLPLLNATGQTAFVGFPAGGGAGIWIDSQGTLAKVARTGDAAPDTAGEYRQFFQPAFNASGRVAFINHLENNVGGVTSENDTGVWSNGVGGSLRLLAREGSPAPGTGSGVNFGGPFPIVPPVLSDSGRSAFWAYLIGPGVGPGNDQGIWYSNGGALQLLFRAGDPAPGTPAGVVFGGRNFAGLPTPAINAEGDIAFFGTLTGPGLSSANNLGIWARRGGGPLALVARGGHGAPGTDRNFRLFDDDPMINDAGRIAFWAYLTGGVAENLGSIWIQDPGGPLRLVARGDTPAPDTDALFGGIHIDSLVLNDLGQTAFIAELTGPTITGDNNLGIWAEDLHGVLRKIVREGDMIDVDDGPGVDLRQVASLRFDGGNSNADGRRTGFNDRGQLAFAAEFTDGTQGVFISNLVAIPEPGSAMLCMTLLPALLTHRLARVRLCRTR